LKPVVEHISPEPRDVKLSTISTVKPRAFRCLAQSTSRDMMLWLMPEIRPPQPCRNTTAGAGPAPALVGRNR